MANLQNYTSEQILSVMNPNRPCVAMHVAKQLGCAKDTAQSYLESLEKEGRVKRIPIDGWYNVWIKEPDFSNWISKDAYNMIITDTEMFLDVTTTECESGFHAAFRYILYDLKLLGYPLDLDLLMLGVNSVEHLQNAIQFNCSYPINANCRLDENRHQVYPFTKDGTADDSFTITVKKQA